MEALASSPSSNGLGFDEETLPLDAEELAEVYRRLVGVEEAG